MPVFNMTVVQVAPKSATSKAGKPYRLVEIAYKNHSWQDKLEEAKINQYSSVFSKVAEMQAGQTYNVTKEKDASGYYQWLSVERASGTPPVADSFTPPVQGKAIGALASTGNPVRSTYETPEERARKQVLIVKQSSLKEAREFHSVGAKAPPALSEVLATAQKMTDWVFEEKPITIGDMVELPNDIDMQVD
jgi:hypothetical protein